MATEHEWQRPEAWKQYRRDRRRVLLPLLASEWAAAWMAYWLSRWAFLRMLDYLGRLTVLVAVIFYFIEAPERTQMRHYQAWQVINTAQGKGGNGGRIDALRQLNEDGVALVGVDLSGAFLQGVNLRGANLARCDMSAADARGADFRLAHFELGNLAHANFRGADFRAAHLGEANLSNADLTGALFQRADLHDADLAGATGLLDITDWEGANITGVKNSPAGFMKWALAHGAKGE